MIFKCEACNDYKGGTGTDKCLNCAEYKYVGHEKSRLVVEYYASLFEDIGSPEGFDSLYPASRKNTIWNLINQLDWKEATMLTQSFFLEMSQSDIAEYHGVQQYQVHRIIARSIEKIKKL